MLMSSLFFLVASKTHAFTLTSTFPKANSKLSCPDPALRLHFDATPRLGGKGKLRILKVNTNTEVYALDFKSLSDHGETGNLTDPVPTTTALATWPWKDTITALEFKLHPLFILGNEVLLPLRTAKLQAATEYSVIADAGLFVNGTSGNAAIADGDWRFTTGKAPNAAATEWVVEGNDLGNLCTVQGAMDALPARGGRAVTVRIQTGVYPELVRIKTNSPLTLVGDGQDKTRIVYRNSDTFNAGTRLRGAFGIEANQVRIFDMLIENSTPKGGSQAEAVTYSGDKLILGRVHLKSFQDTYMGDGRAFFYSCLIEGDVDYIWGSGPAYFHKSELRSLNAGYIVQARNGQGLRGFVFNQCDLTTASGLTGAFLARSAGDNHPYSEVVYHQCTLAAGFSPQGWKFDAGNVSKVIFAEYQSRNSQGTLIDVSKRQTPGRQLTAGEAQNFAKLAYVLGGSDNWQPDTLTAPVGIWANRLHSGAGRDQNWNRSGKPAGYFRSQPWPWPQACPRAIGSLLLGRSHGY